MWRTARLIWFSFAVAALAACTDRSFTPVTPAALNVGTEFTVFAATTRAPEDDGSFGYQRSSVLRHLRLTVSIPPTHTPGSLNFGYGNPDPNTQFVLAGRESIETKAEFGSALRAELSKFPPNEREVTVFVHGFNTTQTETAFRAAQIANDVDLPGAAVIYSWPSRGKALGYAYDNDSVLFARDGLETLLREIADSGVQRILLVAHSVGSQLAMETIRQIDIGNPGWPARHLGGVILIAPDLDVEVFRSQINRLSSVPRPFVIFVSAKDHVLDLSARLRGTISQNRLGNISDDTPLAGLPVYVVDTTAYSNDAGSSHFVPATSPALIALFRESRSVNDTFDDEVITLTSILTGRPKP